MGCGLRKLEEPEDSSPGKIYSNLKRPQVETKTDILYDYALLDFSLEGSRPTVQYLPSLCELPQALQPYYTQGYVLVALHPIILSVGHTRSLPCNLLYRAVLTRQRPSKHSVAMVHSVPVLRVEEWPLPGDSLTSDTVRTLIEQVNCKAREGVRFVGSVLQQAGAGRCNGTVASPRRRCQSPTHTPPGNQDMEDSRYSPDQRLLVLFHTWAPGCVPRNPLTCCYHQGALSMRLSRKGHVMCGLEADWLELTATYYRKGWSLVDSFVYWDTPQGEPVPRSLEGLFVYEEKSPASPANDTIIVEQWTVIEGSDLKTDYGPLLHTLAEFGWLLTCVLPTPIIRHDSEGNLATKQVVFLQRPVKSSHSSQRGCSPREKTSQSVNRGTDAAQSDQLSPSSGGVAGFSLFGGGYSSALSQLEDGVFEQDDGAAEVTCM